MATVLGDADRDIVAAPKTAIRIGWIDCVKGLTIVMVVAHHALLGLDTKGLATAEALRWDESLAAVRMPLFFLVAGLFARRAIDGSLRRFMDGKVLHFAYFYLLWSLILFAVRFGSNGVAAKKTASTEIFAILWDPISTIWFMYGLALAFVFARLTRHLSPVVTIGLALAIQTVALAAPPVPGAIIINKVDHLLLYFLLGVYGSAWIRAQAASARPLLAILLIGAFVLTIGVLTIADAVMMPLLYTGASLIGIAAVIALAAVTQGVFIARLFAGIGTYSLPIYLTHFLPVAAIRVVLLRLRVEEPVLLYVACVAGSVLFGIVAAKIAERTPLAFLFDRPRWAKLNG